MITATAAIATIPKTTSATGFGLMRNALIAPGALLTMPAKMMKLMPLPMPFSVISSPSHIRTIAPAVSVAIWVTVYEVAEVERPLVSTPCALSRARKPYACSSASGTVR